MITMQYKIILPTDYDMNIIKDRTLNNGYKTDGFEGLNFKCYLTTEKGKNGNIQNSYSPLYLWNDIQGMNKFIFQGYFDNILKSFGWQEIETNIPYKINIKNDIQDMKFAIETIRIIHPNDSICDFHTEIENLFDIQETKNFIIIYNPTNWTVTNYSFVNKLENLVESRTVYDILHVSK